MRLRRPVGLVAAALGLLAILVLPSSPAAAADPVTGAGSTFAAIALDQWRADVASQGLSINYNPVGSTAGRRFYSAGVVDFAVSDIPFQGDEIDQATARPYAYLPVVAGGLSFMYNLSLNGQRVDDLRLSGETLAKIFTGAVTNWSDPVIAADNGGRTLPSVAIKPVVRSDGSGTSAQFTAYLSELYPDVWTTGATSLFPLFEGSTAQQGSDGVANAVAAPYNNGAITYVEYGYARARDFPVASLGNESGNFVQPVADNVSIALRSARLNPDGTADLGVVYRSTEPSAYPLSFYSYLIVPITTAPPFTEAKGETLGAFVNYFLCAGQQKAEALGYAPLPGNLVDFGQDALRQIPGAPSPTPLGECDNPAIDPPPPPVDEGDGEGDTFPLPSGFQPEGIALGVGGDFYVGSIPTGDIYRGDSRTGEGAVVVDAPDGRAAIGIEVDRRNRIFVAGGPTGQAYVYDADTGETLATYDLTEGPAFVNDVVVTRQAAYFTDSVNPVIYKVPLGPGGSLSDPGAVEVLPLSGDLVYQDGFNVNGIEATPSGRRLIVVQSNTGMLFSVDPNTGVADAIDLGVESVPNGDGLLFDGFTLYVVQNQLNTVAEVKLRPDLSSGTVESRTTDADFDVPTTVDERANRLYLVNARFTTPPGPDTAYEVVVIPKP